MTLRFQIVFAGLSLVVGLGCVSAQAATPDSLTVKQDPVVNRAVVESVEIALEKLNLATLTEAPKVEQGAGVHIQAVKGSAAPNEKVTVYIDNKIYGKAAEADSVGFWFVYLDTSDLTAGMHRVAYQTSTKARTQLLDFQIIETAPVKPSPTATTAASGAFTLANLPGWFGWLAALIVLTLLGLGYSLYKKHSV